MRSTAQRVRDCRRRQREGRIQVLVELDEVDLTSALIAGRFLDPLAQDNPEAVAAALTALIERVLATEVGDL